MKTTRIFFMAALALTFAACSNDDNDIITPEPVKTQGIPFTATITVDNSATTRALSENGTTIEATWATGEKVALIYNAGSTPTKTEAEVTKQTDGTATISATLAAEATDGSAVTIIYPATAADGTTGNVKADVLAAQNGLLTGTGSIAEKYDLRKGTGKLSISGGKATVNNGTPNTTVSLTNQIAIFKFTLSGPSIDATHPLVIKDGSENVITTVTPASTATSVFVAMPPAASSTYKFIVNTADNKYIKSGTAAITAGKYYQTTLAMTARYPLALASATANDLGSVIASDGNIYLKNAATPGGNTAVAMIAYLGNGSNCTKGLAIQLNSNPESMNWSSACSYTGYPSITGTPGTWRLPSKEDWQNMFLGCAISDDASSASNDMKPIQGFKDKIAATGISWKSTNYWLSPVSGSDAWRVYVNLDGSDAYARFFEENASLTFRVLGCLAF